MNRIKKIFALFHILPWVVAVMQVLWESIIDGQPLRPKGILIGLFVFYLHLFIFNKYLSKRKFKAYFSRLLVVLLTGPFPYLVFLIFIGRKIDRWIDFLDYYVDGLSLTPIFILVSLVVGTLQNLIINTFKKEELEKQAIHAELLNLKSQINPHFLFNTLNNIHTLVYTQAKEAPEAVMQLSSLMRYMIYESNALTVPLTLEIDYLQDYIHLQQLRYEAYPVVDFQVIGDPSNSQIAPLLFIHLLENAYKHSPARLEPGSIKVRMTVNENSLNLTIQNKLGKNREHILEEPGGIGLQNVQKRLQLLYPNAHSLEIITTDKIFTVELKITNLQTQVNERKIQLLYN